MTSSPAPIKSGAEAPRAPAHPDFGLVNPRRRLLARREALGVPTPNLRLVGNRLIGHLTRGWVIGVEVLELVVTGVIPMQHAARV